MKFLFPDFLFALSAVAIPILIHLFNFRKFKKVYFSNVRFLQSIQQQTTSFRKLKNIWLLICRMLAIIFLVFAFARPYIPASSDMKAYQQNIVSIYIDNSYSMESINQEGNLLDDAKRRAKEIASAYNVNDRFQLLTNDFEGRHQRLLSLDEFNSAVNEVKTSAVYKTLNEVIYRQQEIFSSEPNSRKSIYAISDFQKNMVSKEKIKIDTGISFRLVKLKANAQANVSVDSVWFISPVHKAGEIEKLVIQLKNNSDKQAENIPVKLTINNQQKSIASLSIKPRTLSRDTLSFSGLNSGWKKGEIEITDYPIIFDDKFYFSFNVDKQIHILSINEQTANKYLQALYQADPFFNLVNTSVGNINYSSLSNYPLIILNSVNDVSSGLVQQLKGFVQNGGSLLILPSLTDDFSGFKNLTRALNTDIPESIINKEEKVTSVNLQHPIFKGVFEKLPRNIDLPVAKKYVQYSNRSKTNRQSVLELAGRRTFISQYNLGKGKIYLSAVPLTEEAGNFVRHSLIVPIMYQAAFLSLHDNKLFYTIGKDQFLEIPKLTLSQNQILKLKKGAFEIIPDLRQTETNSRIFIADQIKEQGTYSLMKADSHIADFAFNDNRSESDLSYSEKSDLEQMFPDQKVEIFSPGAESVKETIKAVNNGVQLWKLCLILALVFLAVEIFILRIFKPGRLKS